MSFYSCAEELNQKMFGSARTLLCSKHTRMARMSSKTLPPAWLQAQTSALLVFQPRCQAHLTKTNQKSYLTVNCLHPQGLGKPDLFGGSRSKGNHRMWSMTSALTTQRQMVASAGSAFPACSFSWQSLTTSYNLQWKASVYTPGGTRHHHNPSTHNRLVIENNVGKVSQLGSWGTTKHPC